MTRLEEGPSSQGPGPGGIQPLMSVVSTEENDLVCRGMESDFMAIHGVGKNAHRLSQ